MGDVPGKTQVSSLTRRVHTPSPLTSPSWVTGLSWLNPSELQFHHLKSMLSCFSQVQPFVTPGTTAPQASLSKGFFRQEYYNGLPFPTPGDLPDPGIKPESPALQPDSLLLSHLGSPYLKRGDNNSFHTLISILAAIIPGSKPGSFIGNFQ